MDLRKLQYFVSIADWNSFTIAAEKNHISQSALSKHISELEYSLGVKLFTRSKSSTQITPEGKVLLPMARDILSKSNNFSQQAQVLSSTSAGFLRIGYSGYWEYPYLCHLIYSFSEKHPYLRYDFTREHHGKLNYLIRQGLFDMIFTLKQSGKNNIGHDIGWKKLLESPMCIIVSDQHWLASKKSVTLKDLEFETQIIISQHYDYVFHPLISDAFLKAGLMTDYYPSSPNNTYDSLLLVLANKGFVFTSQFMANSHIPGIKMIPLISDIPALEFGIAYRTDRQQNIIRSFMDVVDATPIDQFIQIL